MNKTIKKYENLLPIPGDITKVGLILPEGLAFKDWENIGSCLRLVEGSTQWWIGDWLNYGELSYGEMYVQAVDENDLTYGSLRNVKWVTNKIELSRRHDKLTFKHHSEVASLTNELQDYWLDRAEEEKLSANELRRLIKREGKIFESKELPDDKFNVIYCDPPWQYSNSGFEMSAEENYDTINIDELCDMDIKSISAENCVCFMWVTNPILRDGQRLLKEWGFDYKTNFAWIKENHTAGFYVFGKHEILMIGVRGSMLPTGEKFKSVIEGTNLIHSKKPEIVYNIIEKMYPGCKYIELFARNEREGWKVWGNEI